MKRRDFLVYLSSVLPAAKIACASSWRTFDIVTTVDVASPAGTTLLWVPLPSTAVSDYQHTLSTTWDAPGASKAGLVSVPGYDVTLLRIEWRDPKDIDPVTVKSRVATRDRQANITNRTPEASKVLRTYLQPTNLMPTDGIVRETATGITRNCVGDVEKARALYEWVVENTNRDPKTAGCGMGDVASMLRSGYLGGKCADLNGLFVAMCRSLRIPARDSYGVRVADSQRGYKCLGKSGDISKAQHCRAEFYTASQGWVPVDPADVRKVVLEEEGGLPLSDPKVQAARTALFGSWEMNWIVYNHGHDVALPGSRGLPIPFLMYPNAETAEGRLNSLDPATFRYQIHSTEV
jgi:transglutaminase-like putative cysteine protease